MKKTKVIASAVSLILGVASLTGKNMTAFSSNNISETSYSGGECEDGVMIVPETEDGKIVTEISLWSDDNIKALKIPATVNNVDIIKCLNLEKIEVSEDNPYLCSVDGVIYSKDMKTLVFYPSSKSETAFIVPDTVEVIREGAFSYAQNLKSVKLPYGVKIIKDSAFFGTKITDFELTETLTDIEQYAFSENNSLKSITLPASLKHAELPFSDCEALTEIVILHEIGDEHFESSGARNPDDDYYSALLKNSDNITVFVPDNSYEVYNKYYKDRWKCKNILPLSKYEKNTIKGDANCDGQLDMADAVLIMQALANPNKYGIDGTAEHHLTEQGKLNGDMNGDGLTVGDAQALQKKLLGLDDTKSSQSTDKEQNNNVVSHDGGFGQKWNGKPVSYELYTVLNNTTDENTVIAVYPQFKSSENYKYNGKTIAEYSEDVSSNKLLYEKLHQILKDGDQLKYGELLYTTGTPDGEKWAKELYEQRVEFYGEEFLAKYIVSGEFLRDKVEADIADFSTEPHTALAEAIKAYKKEMIQESIEQLKKQNIKYDYSEASETLIINVTAEEFKVLSLENVSCYYIGASTSSDDGFISTVGTNQ